MGRLTRDPEVRYSQSATPTAITKYGLAVNRRFKRQGEPDADFINIVAFGRAGEFAGKYFKKGMMVCVSGRLQISSWDDNGQKRWSADVIVDEQDFAESKGAFDASQGARTNALTYVAAPTSQTPHSDFIASSETVEDDDLPF